MESNIVIFRTSERKNGKLNYSRKDNSGTVRATKEDFELYQRKAASVEITNEGKFTVYKFTINGW